MTVNLNLAFSLLFRGHQHLPWLGEEPGTPDREEGDVAGEVPEPQLSLEVDSAASGRRGPTRIWWKERGRAEVGRWMYGD